MRKIKVTQDITDGSLISAIREVNNIQSELRQVKYKLDGVSGSGKVQSDMQGTERLMSLIEERMRRLNQYKRQVNDEFQSIDRELANRLKDTGNKTRGNSRLSGYDDKLNIERFDWNSEFKDLRDRALWIMKTKGHTLKDMAAILGIPVGMLDQIVSGVNSFETNRLKDGTYQNDIYNNLYLGASQKENQSVLSSATIAQNTNIKEFLKNTALTLAGMPNTSAQSTIYKSVVDTLTSIPKCYDLPSIISHAPDLLAVLPATALTNISKDKVAELKRIQMVHKKEFLSSNDKKKKSRQSSDYWLAFEMALKDSSGREELVTYHQESTENLSWIERKWNSATEAIEGSWNNTTEAVGEAWDDTTEFVGDAWDDTTEFVGEAWDDTTEFVGEAWDNTTEFVDETIDKAMHADYGMMAGGALQAIGGYTEAATGLGLATGVTAASGGLAAPLAIGGGAYLVVDGTSNMAGGLSSIYNGWNNYNPDDEKAIDGNFMRKGYRSLLGEETGQTVYNITQVAAAAYTIKAGITKQNALSSATNPRLNYQLSNGTAGPLTAKFSSTQAVIGKFNTSGVPIKTITVKYMNFSVLSKDVLLDFYNASGPAEDLVDEFRD